MLRVIDTSHWKGDIVNTNVDIDAVYTKATEGNYYVDDTCDPIVQWAINRGKKWGVYHFATNLITDAATEANYFVDNCLGYVGHGLLILDYENYFWANGRRANNPLDVAWAKAWLDQVYARTGVKPLIYMSLSIVNDADWSPVHQAGYGLIVADYVDDNTPIPNFSMDAGRDPNPAWDGVVGNIMWQFTSTGRLNGYGGNLDCNFFYGQESTWDAYAKVQGSAPPAPDPVPEPTPPPDPAPDPPGPQPIPTPSPAPTPDPVDPPIDPPPLPEPSPEPPKPSNPDIFTSVLRWIFDLISKLIKGVK